MAGTVEEYVEKISRLTKEYKQLIKKEAKYAGSKDNTLSEIKERKLSIYKYIKGKASKCTDERIAIATLIFGAKMFKYLPQEFNQNKEFFLKASNQLNSIRIFKYAPTVITSDKDCAISAIKKDYTMFNYADSSIKQMPDILSLYQWKYEIASIPKELPVIDLKKWGPDADDKFFKNSPEQEKNQEQENDEPDYENTSSQAPMQSHINEDDEPDYDEQINFSKSVNQVQRFEDEWEEENEEDEDEGRGTSQSTNNLPKERDILSDDLDEDTIAEEISPTKKESEKPIQTSKKEDKPNVVNIEPQIIDTSVDDYEGEEDNTPEWDDDDQTLMPGELMNPNEAPKRKGFMGIVDKFLK